MRKWWIGIAVALCGLIVFLALPSNYYLRKAFVHLTPKIDQYPIFHNRVVKAGNPVAWKRASGYNKQEIPEHLCSSFEKYGTVSFVVIQDGELLFENYWEDYSSQTLSNSFSMAKSIVALAVGCAIDDGLIRDVDQPVSDFLSDFSGYKGEVLTIKHLLTMSAGVDFQEAYTSPFSPTTKLYYGNDLRKVAFEMKEIEKPGVNFIYQSGVTQLLAFILEKATGEKLSDYVSRKLWTPMQAEENALWSLDHKDGMEKAYCCFNSNARDFARFGQLVLNKGCWDGKQLISASFLEKATTPDSSLIFAEYQVPNSVYGYQFWHLNYSGMNIPYMRGILGQYVFVIPEQNAVIVRLGTMRSETRTDQFYPDDIDIWLEAGLDILNKKI
ncbi:serine hydrolase [Massilibacteroides sp.]|uniref:serine hydrolase domain-containing protein n=1 Tax=Massilibacteroides sp. TaxID=2034766 RepID=UPI00262D8152|nr:serine hydrolase [Massilibacteroides sp.]MDD4516696.1 serine hydrolase [Massilibacteroides sp.]